MRLRVPRYSMRLSFRFALVLAVLVPALCAIAAAGLYGLQTGREGAHSLYQQHLRATLEVASLQSALQDVHRASLELLLEDAPAQRRLLRGELHVHLVPAVQRMLAPVAALSARDSNELAAVQTINSNWARFETVLADQVPSADTPTRRVDIEDHIDASFTAAVAAARLITDQETAEADQAYRTALRDYDFSIALMLLAGTVGLLCSIATVIWLIRSVLPRTLSYSAFATSVGDGDYTRRLQPEGADELAQLGRALDDLADRREAEDSYDRAKLELVDALQLTENEPDAHELLRRHLERTITDTTVTILNRDNSSGRLRAVTPVEPCSPLATGLEAAQARSCLAIRTARPHATSAQADLLPCSVCAGCPALSSCVPLIVSGEVIGSVLTLHQKQLSDTEQRSIRESVTQAAPVIGNLRSLAVAEHRATTDGLTGLPNRRAIEDAIRRMVAHTGRTMHPLSALMCDLDDFKAINDRYGHGCGDDVLAAAAAAMSASIRASDFAGRYGGEEFLVLLPATDAAGAYTIAEKIRAAIEAIHVPTVELPITISIGVATLPDHAIDADSLLHAADIALYVAKSGGRNRTELAQAEPPAKCATTATAHSHRDDAHPTDLHPATP